MARLDLAMHLVELASTLTSGQWADVAARATAADAARAAAARRLSDAMVGHPQTRALAALARTAWRAARGAGRTDRYLTAEQSRHFAERVVANAALATALAGEIAEDDVRVLVTPLALVGRRRRPTAVGDRPR